MKLKVLVGCECSGRVRDAFIALGHDAWSCDLEPSDGPHYQGDVTEILSQGWDIGIFHPPCTFLTNSAEWAYGPGPYHMKVKDGTLTGERRREARIQAILFALSLMDAPIQHIAFENPVGVLSRYMGKPSQIIQPHQFGDDASKKTCLWLKNLPKLIPTCHISPRMVNGRPRWSNQTDSGQNKLGPSKSRSSTRSVTYQGIADAMASQWSEHVIKSKM